MTGRRRWNAKGSGDTLNMNEWGSIEWMMVGENIKRRSREMRGDSKKEDKRINISCRD